MSWQAHSEYLTPTEPFWDKLDRKFQDKQPTSAAHLWQQLYESWAELSSVYFQSFGERMLRTSEAVIAAKGGHFDESRFKKFSLVFFGGGCM